MANRKNATGEYHFNDVEMSQFILYDYRMTTKWEENIEGYDYENQDHIRPKMRKIKRETFEEFWQS